MSALLYIIIIAASCGAPLGGVNSHLDVYGTHYTHTAVYTCNHGYSVNPEPGIPGSESLEINCTADGTWSNAPMDCSCKFVHVVVSCIVL